LQRTELESAERDPQEASDFVSNRLEEPADLAVLAFGQLDDEMRLALRLFSHVH